LRELVHPVHRQPHIAAGSHWRIVQGIG
jgi:hypothetical protein